MIWKLPVRIVNSKNTSISFPSQSIQQLTEHIMYKERQSRINEQEIIIPFSINCYPFPSLTQPVPTYFKTSELFALDVADLNRLTSIQHRNMVNLKRVVRTSLKNDSKEQINEYCLYYEAVNRGIHNRKKLSEGLRKLGSYMVQHNILYKIRQIDIGYDQFGQVKVFLSPLAILGKSSHGDQYLKNYQLTADDVQESITQLLSSNLSDSKDKVDRINEIDKQLQEIRKIVIKDNRRKDVKSKQTGQASNNLIEYNASIGRINRQLGNGFPHNKHSQSPTIPQKNIYQMKYNRCNADHDCFRNQHLRIIENKRQSLPHEVLRQSGLNQMNLRFPIDILNWGISSPKANRGMDIVKSSEKFQQNINCINIYHNVKEGSAPRPLMQPIVSRHTKPPTFNILHSPTTKKISGNYEGGSDSLDTYQMQIGQNRQMPKMIPRIKLRHTVRPTSSLGQINYNTSPNHRQDKRCKGEQTQKMIYGSVGHKQFSEILRLTAKDSNSQANRNNPIQRSKIHEQNSETESIQIDEGKLQDKRMRGEQIVDKYIKKEEYRSPVSMNNSKILRPDLVGVCHRNDNKEIQNRVSQALLKTKAAIEMLKKTRTNCNLKN